MFILVLIHKCVYKPDEKQNLSKKEQLYKKITNPVFISEEYSFIKVIEDVSGAYKYPDGIYYAFDFTNYRDQWDGVEDELKDLSDMQVKIMDAWYQGEGSGCVNPKSNWSSFVKVYRQFYFRSDQKNQNIIKSGYKEVSEINFQCPFQIVHIINSNHSDNSQE